MGSPGGLLCSKISPLPPDFEELPIRMTLSATNIKCAGTVAYLEGANGIPLPDDILESNNLTAIESRVRRLERKSFITNPPPGLTPTWDSLTMRLCRLTSRTTFINKKELPHVEGLIEALSDGSEVSIETFKTMCIDIMQPGSRMISSDKVATPISWPKSDDVEDTLTVVREYMCYAAGKNHVLPGFVPVSRQQIYRHLVHLTILFDSSNTLTRSGLPGPMNPPWARPPPFRQGNRHSNQNRSCCKCCSCSCHDDQHSDTSSDTESILSVPKKRFPGIQWLKSLFCIKRSTLDDSSSTSSKTIY